MSSIFFNHINHFTSDLYHFTTPDPYHFKELGLFPFYAHYVWPVCYDIVMDQFFFDNIPSLWMDIHGINYEWIKFKELFDNLSIFDKIQFFFWVFYYIIEFYWVKIKSAIIICLCILFLIFFLYSHKWATPKRNK